MYYGAKIRIEPAVIFTDLGDNRGKLLVNLFVTPGHLTRSSNDLSIHTCNTCHMTKCWLTIKLIILGCVFHCYILVC